MCSEQHRCTHFIEMGINRGKTSGPNGPGPCEIKSPSLLLYPRFAVNRNEQGTG
jgi:hypothetical protein